MKALVHHRVEVLDPHAHLYSVTLTIAHPEATTVLALPVWIPGSYLVREFSQHLQNLRAHQGGQLRTWTQTAKNHWQLDGVQTTSALTVSFEVYALDASVRTAWLDAQRGFFNGTSVCLRVLGQEHTAQQLQVPPPAHTTTWHLATGLTPVVVDDKGFGTYTAENYAQLVDAPVEMGAFWSADFDVRGIPHRFVVNGAGPWLDGERLVADTRRICETEMAFWHGANGPPPFDRYVFMLQATHDGYGGLEHHNSTALICPRADLPRLRAPQTPPETLKATDGYTSLLGLISHEYFHTWNVKRLRPAEFTTYDLDRENPTELLWFFEGFTSYYDDLLLLRAGLIDTTTYLHLLAKTINQVAQTPGRLVHTVAQASLEAWTKYYRVQENTPNATVSYYTKGALVALCLDLTLRQHGSHLDAVMLRLWTRCQGGPMTESDLRQVLREAVSEPLDRALDTWVHSTQELPVAELLQQHGVHITHDAAPLAQRLGLRVNDQQGLVLRNVLRGGPAEQAGMAAGDEWVAVGFGDGEIWRVHKLDEVAHLMGTRTQATAWVSRDRRLLALPLTWPEANSSTVCSLSPPPATLSSVTSPSPSALGWPASV